MGSTGTCRAGSSTSSSDRCSSYSRRRDHGSEDPRDVTIPWIAWGEGVEAGALLPPAIRTMDTAATALWLLGVPAPEASVGRPVAAAFDQVRAVLEPLAANAL